MNKIQRVRSIPYGKHVLKAVVTGVVRAVKTQRSNGVARARKKKKRREKKIII